MDDKLLRFFDHMPEALPLYQKFEREVLSRVEDVHIKVQKTQITYSNRHVFACVSFAKVRKFFRLMQNEEEYRSSLVSKPLTSLFRFSLNHFIFR